MTPTELRFFALLSQASPDLLIAPQVALAALVDIAEKQKHDRYQHVNRAKIASQRLDFVLLNRTTGKVAAVIELDDHTHDNARQRERDKQRDTILNSTGYKVLRFDARRLPSATELQTQLSLLTRGAQ